MFTSEKTQWRCMRDEQGTVKPVLRDHCHERPPVLKDHQFGAESSTFQCKWTCHQRPPVLRDNIFCGQWGGLSRQVPLYNVFVLGLRDGHGIVFSDHYAVVFTASLMKSFSVQKTVSYRKFRSINSSGNSSEQIYKGPISWHILLRMYLLKVWHMTTTQVCHLLNWTTCSFVLENCDSAAACTMVHWRTSAGKAR